MSSSLDFNVRMMEVAVVTVSCLQEESNFNLILGGVMCLAPFKMKSITLISGGIATKRVVNTRYC